LATKRLKHMLNFESAENALEVVEFELRHIPSWKHNSRKDMSTGTKPPAARSRHANESKNKCTLLLLLLLQLP